MSGLGFRCPRCGLIRPAHEYRKGASACRRCRRIERNTETPFRHPSRKDPAPESENESEK